MIQNIQSPRQLLIGGGTVARVSEVLAGLGLSRPLVVTDPWMVSSGTVEKLLGPLAQAGIRAGVFHETVPDPTDTVVMAAAAAFRAGDYDSLIGFGGGSPMDTAKAVALMAHPDAPAHIRALKVPHAANLAAAPVICVPTTAGTGSEATRFTVITDTGTDEKMLIAGLGALPLAAVVDYELTLSVPPRTTADTGIDSFTHALEAYVSQRANPVADMFAERAMRVIGPNLRTVYHNPGDRAAREAMMLGATLAGLAFSNSSVALVHGMSRPIGAHFHVPHGLSNAMLLPAVTRFSLASALPRYAQAARLMGCAAPADADQVAGAKLLDELAALNAELKVPSPAGYGIDADAWNRLLPTMAQQALASGSPGNNPSVPDAEQIMALYQEAYGG